MPAYLLVTNPVSGRGLTEDAIARLTALFDERGATLDVHRTRGAGDAERVVAIHEPAYDAVIVAGGDGTISEVVNGLAGRDVPLGIIPRGTANVLAKELRLPKDLSRAAEIIMHRRTRRLDVGLADGRRFVLMASAGYDAQVIDLAHRGRKSRFGYANYILPIATAFTRADFPEIRAEIDGVTYTCRHIIVANVENYGGPLHPARGAVHNDGLFDVVMYTRGGRWSLLRYSMAAFLKRTSRARHVVRLQASKVALSSDGVVQLQLDGDPAGTLPRTLEIIHNGISVIVP